MCPTVAPPLVMPASHRDLVECPPVAALTTIGPNGEPQTSVVWCDVEGPLVRVNTMRGFAKERNMRRDPRVALLCYDPLATDRYLELRGRVVEMTELGAGRHLDELASKYAGRPVRYFGDVVPAALAETEIPLLCRIQPTHVVALDARARQCLPRASESPHTLRPPGAEQGGSPAIRTRRATAVPLPASHADLFDRPICGVLTTLGRSGGPESSLVWVDRHEGTARVNTTMERRKVRNVLRDPRVSLLVVDSLDTSRFVQIRGEVELSTDGALDHLDALTRKYTRHPSFYGHVHPVSQQTSETRVSLTILADRVTLDAIHAGPVAAVGTAIATQASVGSAP